jgi:hypothetical protein
MAELTREDLQDALSAVMRQNNSLQAKEIAKAMNGGKAPTSASSIKIHP